MIKTNIFFSKKKPARWDMWLIVGASIIVAAAVVSFVMLRYASARDVANISNSTPPKSFEVLFTASSPPNTLIGSATVIDLPSPTVSSAPTATSSPTVIPATPTITVTVKPVTVTPKSSPTPALMQRLAKLSDTGNVQVIKGYVNIHDLDSDIVIDLRYAGTNNFTKQKVYSAEVCVLLPAVAEKLLLAQKDLEKQGYGLKIWDAYRPYSDHKILQSKQHNSAYIAQGPSMHCRGLAVDVTMVDLATGQQVDMPSDFDDFTGKGSRYTSMTAKQKQNLNILTNAMTKEGFNTLSTEWWHFQMFSSSYAKYTDYDLATTFPNWIIVE